MSLSISVEEGGGGGFCFGDVSVDVVGVVVDVVGVDVVGVVVVGVVVNTGMGLVDTDEEGVEVVEVDVEEEYIEVKDDNSDVGNWSGGMVGEGVGVIIGLDVGLATAECEVIILVGGGADCCIGGGIGC